MCFFGGMGGGGGPPQIVYRDKEVMVPAKPADPLLPPPPSSSGLPMGVSDSSGKLIDTTPSSQAPSNQSLASAFKIDPNAVDQSNLDNQGYSIN